MCDRANVQSRHGVRESCHQEVAAEFTVKISRVGDHHRVLLQLRERTLHLTAFVRRLRHGAEGGGALYSVTEVHEDTNNTAK